ncbi:MAG: DNA repair protein RecO [Oscillospiraceae bacterium]|nr:DNA repair protein RecO [Oscillospiraceae bacterium]
MQMKTEGLILRTQDYKESDKLLTILTKDAGVVTAYAGGASKLKNRFSCCASPLCYAEFVLFKNREKYTVDNAEPKELFFRIRQDLTSLSYASYFCELAMACIPAEEPSAEILRLTLNTLYLLENKKRPPEQLKAIYELRLMSVSGFRPDLVACSECGEYEKELFWFSAAEGKVCCGDCMPAAEQGRLPLSKSAFFAARHIVYAPDEKLFSFTVGGEALGELSEAAEQYLLCRTERNYKTLDFLKSVGGMNT